MIGYVTLGTNNLEKNAKFYDALLGEIGAKRIMEFERFIAWGVSETQPGLRPDPAIRRQAGTVGNGRDGGAGRRLEGQRSTSSTRRRSSSEDRRGPAGPRGDGFYAGYFRDLDGNKLNVFCTG
jgi:catechol 2,3-dioxygenase-like lactoylglutathione lyase family enzyme